MKWALDQIGILTDAAQRGLFSYGLTCPTCGQPVYKRSGAERRPHFAHYSHTAKPECENYHPSSYVTKPGGIQLKESILNKTICPGGIFWERNKRGTYSLLLKLPQLLEGMNWHGEIQIHTRLGVGSYREFQLKRPLFVKILPELPVAEVTTSGELDMLGAAVALIVQRFRSDANYFTSNGSGGRLLAPEEPLEWGEQYWLLSKNPLVPISAEIAINVEPEVPKHNWYPYEITLPSLSETRSEIERSGLEMYLGRIIRSSRARVYFVDPPPHHIKLDGTHVFSEVTERILLRRTGCSHISLKGSAQTVCNAHIYEITDEWVEIRSIGQGDFAVLLDGHEELLGSIESCELFQSRGVHIILGDRYWEIFEPELKDTIRQGFNGCLCIDCQSKRIADKLDLPRELWFREDASYTSRGNMLQDVDAKNFGFLACPVPVLPETEMMNVFSPQIFGKRKWLEGLVACLYGSEALQRLHKQFDKTLPIDLSGEMAWLQPYIVNARSS